MTVLGNFWPSSWVFVTFGALLCLLALVFLGPSLCSEGTEEFRGELLFPPSGFMGEGFSSKHIIGSSPYFAHCGKIEDWSVCTFENTWSRSSQHFNFLFIYFFTGQELLLGLCALQKEICLQLCRPGREFTIRGFHQPPALKSSSPTWLYVAFVYLFYSSNCSQLKPAKGWYSFRVP